MRAAKMMCANKRKKPIAMKKGGNPVAKSLASPALRPKVVKPKKGKGSYNRKAPSVKQMKGGGKTPKSRTKLKTPKGSPSFNIAKSFMAKKPVSYSKARAYDTGGDVKAMNKGGKTKSKVNEAGNYTKPTMRKNLFNRIKAGGKGGAPGQWSARKAQMLASAYKKKGGGYRG